MIPHAQFIDASNISALVEVLSSHEPDEDTFLTSPAYLHHTGRRGLWLIGDATRFATYCRHPNQDGSLLVFPQPGRIDIEFWHYVSQMLARQSASTTLGRVHSRYRNEMRKTLIFARHKEEILDWRFPCTILSNEALVTPIDSSLSLFRKKLNRFRSKVVRTVPITSAVDQRHGPQVRALIERWAVLVAAQGRFELNDLREPNYNAYRMALDGNYHGFNAAVVLVESRAVAFFTSENPVRGNTVNGITMCVDREFSGAAELAHREMAALHLANGYPFTNINGAETESLDRFRRKLCPVRRYEIDSYRPASSFSP
jgi:hypothetical protein